MTLRFPSPARWRLVADARSKCKNTERKSHGNLSQQLLGWSHRLPRFDPEAARSDRVACQEVRGEGNTGSFAEPAGCGLTYGEVRAQNRAISANGLRPP